MISSRIFSKKNNIFILLFLASSLLAKESKSNIVLDNLLGTRAGGFEYSHYDAQGHLLWVIAGQGTMLENEMKIRVTNPLLKVIQVSGNAIIKADEALVKSEDQWCFLSGNVQVLGYQDINLSAGQLTLRIKDQHLAFGDGFRLERSYIKVAGESGTFDGKQGLLNVDGHSISEVFP